MKTYPIYIAGKFTKTATSLEVKNPYHQKTFAQTFQASAKDLEKSFYGCRKRQKNNGGFTNI